MRRLKNIMVTGGAGFIGSNFIRYLLGCPAAGNALFCDADFGGNIVNVDSLTYAGHLGNLSDVESAFDNGRYVFEKTDICDRTAVERILKQYDIDTVVHFAAETHVDRSILNPALFLRTNVTGTFTLLDAAKTAWERPDGRVRDDVLFHYISTDEVYGSLGDTGAFTENSTYAPRSPYSASKAAGGHIALAYYHTYGLPVTISHCSNNYGPYQTPEKFLPLVILSILNGRPIPLYGTGDNIRDWIYVDDHNAAVWLILKEGRTGERYNIGGENEWQNIKLLKKVIEIMSERLGRSISEIEKTVTYVKDRPGHDKRYAIDASKIKHDLGWKCRMPFKEGLSETIDWYLGHSEWLRGIEVADITGGRSGL